MINIWKSTLIMGAVACVSVLILSHVMKFTLPGIMKQEKERELRALALVLPGYKAGEKKSLKIDGGEFVYWTGEKLLDEKREIITDKSGTSMEKNADKEDPRNIITGYAFISDSPGYSGNVKTIVGVDQTGIILGISILEQTETPGLGARCVEIASRQTLFGLLTGKNIDGEEAGTPWFQDQFKGIDGNKKIAVVKKGDWNPGIRDGLLKGNSVSAITGATITTRAVINGISKGLAVIKKINESIQQTREGKK